VPLRELILGDELVEWERVEAAGARKGVWEEPAPTEHPKKRIFIAIRLR